MKNKKGLPEFKTSIRSTKQKNMSERIWAKKSSETCAKMQKEHSKQNLPLEVLKEASGKAYRKMGNKRTKTYAKKNTANC